MKTSRLPWFPVAVLTFFGGIVAADPPPPSPPGEMPRTVDSHWNVRAEGLAVVMPPEKALAWLPDLRDENKIAGAVAQILDAVGKKEVTLVGYPQCSSWSGDPATAETIEEILYPSQFQLPQEPQTIGPPPKPTRNMAFPSAFESRHVGLTLEVRPTVHADGQWIELFCDMQHTRLQSWDTYEAERSESGAVFSVKQPDFFVVKSSAELTLRNNAYALIGIHKILQPEGAMELFIVHSVATSAGR